MIYFDELEFGFHNHLPQCQAWMDQEFPYAALNYAHAGRIRWAMGDGPLQTLHAPVAWWTVPGIRYVYGNCAGESWDHYYVTFTGPRVRRMIRGGLMPANAHQPHFRAITDASRFRAAMEALLAYVAGDAAGNARRVHALEEVLLQIGEQQPVLVSMGPLESEVRDWIERIRLEPALPWDLAIEARRMAVSTMHLRRIVKQMTGLPPGQFITKTRLDVAAQLLRSTSLPIGAIASQTGLGNIAYFSRLFRRQYGFAPTEYRKEAQLLYAQSVRPPHNPI